MKGAFHGVIIAAGPAGIRTTRFEVPFELQPAPGALGEVGIGAEVPRSARDDAGAQRAFEHRHVEALDRGDALDVLVDQIGETPQPSGPPGYAEPRPGGERSLGRLDG